MGISRLVYVSTANPDLMLTDIDAIVATARARNEIEGITGLLSYNGFNFMQLLEGPPASVERVFDSIGQDSRHSGVITVLSQAADTRLFAGWSMAFARTGKGGDQRSLAVTTQALSAYLPEALSPELHMLFVRFNTLSAFDGLPPDDGELRPAR
ncbi:MAG: BLUF domain protein [Oceanicaulis sp. HLUCCA04]|nr:MAG: BLUF domain protein [Oceanicaulis sp. HLUCCA04]